MVILEDEIWKPIIYEGIDYKGIYEVSSMGRIKKNNKNKVLKGFIQLHYKKVSLSFNKSRKIVSVHRLVATCFISEIKHKQVVDHINSNRLDNRLCNLRIVSHRENTSKERVLKSKLPCGVSLNKKTGKRKVTFFNSKIKILGNQYFLGQYTTIQHASDAYITALSAINSGLKVSEILKAVDKYRISIQLPKIERSIKTPE